MGEENEWTRTGVGVRALSVFLLLFSYLHLLQVSPAQELHAKMEGGEKTPFTVAAKDKIHIVGIN